ncbi:MFS transporter [Companilactobacillus kimchiensis]|nr:MFS transporter [Companilactobacillus kimchiensis]
MANHSLIQRQISLSTIATFVSGMSNGSFTFAIGLLTLRESKSPIWFACTQIVSPIIALLINRIVGNIVDHNSHKKILLSTYLGEILIIAMYAFLINQNTAEYLKLSLTILVVMLIGIFSLFEQSAYQSSIIGLVPEDKIQQLNSLQRTASSLSSVIAPSIGAALFSTLGMSKLLIFQIIMILITLICVSTLVFEAFNQNQDTDNSPEIKISIGEILKSNRKLIYSVSAAIGVNLFIAISNTSIPIMALHQLNFTNQQYALIETIFGIGAVASGLVLARFKTFKNPIRISASAMMVAAATIFLLGLFAKLPFSHLGTVNLILLAVLIQGISFTVMEVPMGSYMQMHVAKKVQGSYFSFVFGASQAIVPIGVIIATIFSSVAPYLLLIAGILMFIFIFTIYNIWGKNV